MYDVIIIGGSIAGSATAIHLARANAHVLLIDRDEFPRNKACGEAIFPKGVDELAALGLLSEIELAGVHLNRLRFRLDEATAECNISPSGSRGLGIKRSELDTRLLSHAAHAGAEIATGVAVRDVQMASPGEAISRVTTNSGLIETRAIVAADGLNSRMRRQVGLDGRRSNYRYGISAHFEYSPDIASRIDVHFYRGHEVYVTPVGVDLVNVALLCDKPTLRPLSNDLKTGLLRLLPESVTQMQPSWVDGPHVTGPFPAKATHTWRRNLLLVGDAAGFFDAITGEGMSIALRGARLAAGAMLAFLATGSETPLRNYERALRGLQRPSRLLASAMLALAAHPLLARRAIRNLGRKPDTFSRLVGFNSGELGLMDLQLRDVAGMLFGV